MEKELILWAFLKQFAYKEKQVKCLLKKLPPLLLQPFLQQEREERKVVVVKEKTTREIVILCCCGVFLARHSFQP